MDQEPNSEQPVPDQPIAQPAQPPTGPVVMPQQNFETTPSVPQVPVPSSGGSKGKLTVIILALLILLVGGAAAYWFLLRPVDPSKSNDQTASTPEQSQDAENESDQKVWKPIDPYPLTLTHDSSWSEKYWVGVKGLVKDIGGVKYLLTLTLMSLDYDYMDRSAGGAFPPGTLHKAVTTDQGKTVYVGTFTFKDKEDGAFVSTCPLTSDGGCSVKVVYSDGSQSYVLVQLHRYLPEQDTDAINLSKAKTYLDLKSSTDKQALDEFTEMMSTLTY